MTALPTPSAPTQDGSHDFDFLIGDWKAYVRRLPDRLPRRRQVNDRSVSLAACAEGRRTACDRSPGQGDRD